MVKTHSLVQKRKTREKKKIAWCIDVMTRMKKGVKCIKKLRIREDRLTDTNPTSMKVTTKLQKRLN